MQANRPQITIVANGGDNTRWRITYRPVLYDTQKPYPWVLETYTTARQYINGDWKMTAIATTYQEICQRFRATLPETFPSGDVMSLTLNPDDNRYTAVVRSSPRVYRGENIPGWVVSERKGDMPLQESYRTHDLDNAADNALWLLGRFYLIPGYAHAPLCRCGDCTGFYPTITG